MFQRNIRFHVEICTVKSVEASSPESYYVTFTLITGKLSTTHRCTRLFSLSVGQARRFKKLCEEIQALFLTSKERLAKQRRPAPTYDTRPVTATPSNPTTPMTARSNASLISSLFGNAASPCQLQPFDCFVRTTVFPPPFYLDAKSPTSQVQSSPQQQSSSSSISSLSSTSNVSLTNPLSTVNPTASPYSIPSTIKDESSLESTRLKLAHRLAI